MMDWISRKKIVTQLNFPVLVHSDTCMTHVTNPVNLMWGSRKIYDIGTYDSAVITDSDGAQIKLIETRLETVRLKSFFDILDFVSFSKKYWPYQISAKISVIEKVEFEKFRFDIIDFIIAHKWVISSDPAFFKTDRNEIIETAKNTETFSELFEVVQHSMSRRYLKELFES